MDRCLRRCVKICDRQGSILLHTEEDRIVALQSEGCTGRMRHFWLTIVHCSELSSVAIQSKGCAEDSTIRKYSHSRILKIPLIWNTSYPNATLVCQISINANILRLSGVRNYLFAWWKRCPKIKKRFHGVEGLIVGHILCEALGIVQKFIILFLQICFKICWSVLFVSTSIASAWREKHTAVWKEDEINAIFRWTRCDKRSYLKRGRVLDPGFYIDVVVAKNTWKKICKQARISCMTELTPLWFRMQGALVI